MSGSVCEESLCEDGKFVGTAVTKVDVLRRESLKRRAKTSRDKLGDVVRLFNGFLALPELEVIRIDDATNIAPFSLPQEALTFMPDADVIAQTFSNGESERMIHCNIELNDQEQSSLRRCREEATRRGLSFLPVVSIAASRYVMDSHGDIDAAIEQMQQVQNWYLDFFKDGPIVDTEIAETFKHGVVYFSGRDHSLRPVLIVRPNVKTNLLRSSAGAEKVARAFVFCMEYFTQYMMIPGKVESVCVIIDVKGLSFTNTPLKVVRHIISVTLNQPAGRLCKIYIVNMKGLVSACVRVVLAACNERVRQKVVVVKDTAELQHEYALHQLEQDLGGTMPIVRKFFPFPLQAGPFECGWRGGPNPNAVPKVHEAITAAGFRGRAWDPRVSREENSQVQYTQAAGRIFEKCGLSAPEVCNDVMYAPASLWQGVAEDEGADFTSTCSGLSANEVPEEDPTPPVTELQSEGEPDGTSNAPVVFMQDCQVRPSGMLSCARLSCGPAACR